MTQTPDPTFHALNQLVVEGRLAPAQAEAALHAGRAGTPPQRVVPAWFKPDVLLVLFGSSLLFAAAALSTVWTRDRGDIDWSNYIVGLGATAMLLAVAVGGWFLVPDERLKANLVSWPGALGIVGVGQMIGVAMNDSDASLWVIGVVVLGLGTGAYHLSRQPAFVVAALVGVFALYLKVFDSAYGVDDVDGDNVGIALGAAVFIFVVLVSVAGWFLPTRDLTGIIVGVFAVIANTVTMAVLFFASSLMAAFSGLDASMEGGPARKEPDNPYVNDVWFLIAFSVLLTLVWAAMWWLRGHDGYRILVLAMLSSVIPIATLALATEHPSWWGVVVAVLGAAGVALAVLRALGMVGAGARSRA